MPLSSKINVSVSSSKKIYLKSLLSYPVYLCTYSEVAFGIITFLTPINVIILKTYRSEASSCLNRMWQLGSTARQVV